MRLYFDSTKLGIAAIAICGLLACTLSPICAQDVPVAQASEHETGQPSTECARQDPDSINISASAFELNGSKIFAEGQLRIQRGGQRLFADEAEYDMEANTGNASNVFITTCSCEKPHYHISAKNIKLLPNQKLIARGLSVHLGKTRIISLPRMVLRLNNRTGPASLFPRLSNDSQEGLTLRHSLRLVDTPRTQTTLDLKLTENLSIQPGLDARYGMRGQLVNFPGRYLSNDLTISRAIDVTEPLAKDSAPKRMRSLIASRLQAFARHAIRQRTYDISDPNLLLYRQPELGIVYQGSQLSAVKQTLDPRLELYPQIFTTWGVYKENQGQVKSLNRTRLVMQGAVNTVRMGPRTAIQPLGIATISSYSNGDSYRTYGWGIDAAHLTHKGAFYSARYVSRTSSGATPFKFDDIDIKRELDLTVRTYHGKHVYGLSLNYDIASGTLFDWEVLYGQRTDCLGTYLRWNNRFKHLSFDIGLINL
ncbi:MAG: hypothetical protein GX139_08740 [Armatimonadetes bacterium]|nr:hypothetical protein [Armatimonadota bacterium]